MNSKQRDQIREHMAAVLGIKVVLINDEAPLVELVRSSFMLVELIIDLQEEFGVHFGQAEMRGVQTVGQLIDLFIQLLTQRPQPVSAG